MSKRKNTYNGVYKQDGMFHALIVVDYNRIELGGHRTAEEAAHAYDDAVIKYKLPLSKLNFPDRTLANKKIRTLDDKVEGDSSSSSSKRGGNKRKLSSNNTTGYRGVYKSGKRFVAQIRFNHKSKFLGRHDTPKEAALAYDRAIIKHKLSSSKLNFPEHVHCQGDDPSDDPSEDESEIDDNELAWLEQDELLKNLLDYGDYYTVGN